MAPHAEGCSNLWGGGMRATPARMPGRYWGVGAGLAIAACVVATTTADERVALVVIVTGIFCLSIWADPERMPTGDGDSFHLPCPPLCLILGPLYHTFLFCQLRMLEDVRTLSMGLIPNSLEQK